MCVANLGIRINSGECVYENHLHRGVIHTKVCMEGGMSPFFAGGSKTLK